MIDVAVEAVRVTVRRGRCFESTTLFVNADPLYTVNSQKIVALAARHAMLTVCSTEGFAADGGLISYGASIDAANRQLWSLYRPSSQGHSTW